MKKVLSILLVLTMLLSMVVAAIPTGAAVVSAGANVTDEPTYNANTIGNQIITADKQEEYKEALLDAGYIPIVNSAEKKAELVEAGIPDVRWLGDSNVKLSHDKSFFLWEDIDYTIIKNWGYENTTIDGAGHTINMTVESLYTKLNGVTLKNVTIAKATPTVLTSSDTMPTVLVRYNSVTSYVRLENVTIDVDYTYTSYPKQPLTSGVIVHKLNAGSYLKNVLIDSTINVDLNSTGDGDVQGFNTFGAVASSATSSDASKPVLLENVVNRGTLNITGRISHGVNIAGILGTAGANVKLDRCFNEMDINVKHGAVLGTMSGPGKIAGLVGNASAGTVFKDCVNSGDITIGGNGTDLTQMKIAGVGGIVANATGNSTTNYMFDGCVNKGNITFGSYVNVWYDSAKADITDLGVGGLIGTLNGSVAINNCTNKGELSSSAYNLLRAFGGLVGCANNSNAVIKGCTNKGAVDISENGKANAGVAGFVGRLNFNNGDATFKLEDCVNSAAVYSKNGAVGGMIGKITARNESAKSTIDVDLTRCVNEGQISGVKDFGGGFVGNVEAAIYENDANKDVLAVDVDKCLNLGKIVIQNEYVAGIVGGTSNSSDGLTVTVSNSVNAGEVHSGGNAAGIFGAAKVGSSNIVIDKCINAGTIYTLYGTSYNANGIFGQAWNDASTGYDFDVEIKNTINFGKLNSATAGSSKELPIGLADTLDNVWYYVGCLDEGATSTNGQAIDDISAAYAKAAELNTMRFSLAELNAAITKAEPYFVKPGDYVKDTIDNLTAKYDAAKQVAAAGYWGYAEGSKTVVFAAQTPVVTATDELVEAIEGTVLKSEMVKLITDAISKAEAFLENNTNVYKNQPWQEFLAALVAAKELEAQGNLANMEYSTIYPVAKRLNDALKVLERDETALGNNIFTAEELVALEGQQGEFTLKRDITVTAPIKNFKGTLNGNGYTITLAGCALFETLDGATVTNLKIVGDTGAAKSIFGKANGVIRIGYIYVDVDGALDAALFDEVQDEADIAISTVMSFTDAKVAALVAGSCTVAVEKALVMAKAPALVTAADARVRLSYVDGVEYYKANGEKSTDADVFASGEVTYVMNEALGLDDMLVQRIGKDALPKMAVALADGSNVVRFANGKYYNAGDRLNVNIDTPNPAPSAPLAFTALEAAIERAEALVEANYTAETWAALVEALAAANELVAEEQADIDAAVYAINLAMAGLKTKSEATQSVDLSKLNAAIEKAEALNVNDYTVDSFKAVQTALANAKRAKIGKTQEEVDAIVKTLEDAIAALAKAPVADDDADVSKKPEADDETKDEGCGSVIGGAAVILTAVLALGAGVSFKKKED